jgi:hypothetical protein
LLSKEGIQYVYQETIGEIPSMNELLAACRKAMSLDASSSESTGNNFPAKVDLGACVDPGTKCGISSDADPAQNQL